MKAPSLWRYLWRWALGALTLAWVTLMGASYYAGLHEAAEVTDAHLASAVNVLLQVSAFGAQSGDPSQMQIPQEQEFQSFIPRTRHLNLARSLAVMVWDNGRIVADSRPLDQRWPVSVPDGYSNFMGQPAGPGAGHHWRVFAATRAHDGRRAAAMIDMEQRTRIGREVARTIALPALVVLPVVALLLWWAMRRGMQPLNALSARVAGLDLHSGERLAESRGFAEFASMVTAINGLIDRLQLQATRERAFAADVAHELRTPLAAMALQSQIALSQEDTALRAAALTTLQREALRGGQILGELLDMARAQRFGNDALQAVPLQELAAHVLASFAQASHESGHLLELARDGEDVAVRGNPLLLELALRNLVANALGHTAAGTLVRVAATRENGGVRLSVSDNGQGADAQNPRADGKPSPYNLGIGLKLVERIAGLHQARLLRDAGEPPMSTRFSIVWSADAPGG